MWLGLVEPSKIAEKPIEGLSPREGNENPLSFWRALAALVVPLDTVVAILVLLHLTRTAAGIWTWLPNASLTSPVADTGATAVF